jgi:hypothetical protein
MGKGLIGRGDILSILCCRVHNVRVSGPRFRLFYGGFLTNLWSFSTTFSCGTHTKIKQSGLNYPPNFRQISGVILAKYVLVPIWKPVHGMRSDLATNASAPNMGAEILAASCTCSLRPCRRV